MKNCPWPNKTMDFGIEKWFKQFKNYKNLNETRLKSEPCDTCFREKYVVAWQQ